MRILVAEDDRGLREALSRGLRESGYTVDAVPDGQAAVEYLRTYDYEVVVLDWRMPQVSGLEVLQWMRRDARANPVLMLTARDTPRDRVTGLDEGADDYLIKPFAGEELAARVRALLRRGERPPAKEQLTVGSLVVDPAARAATVGERPLDLGATEFRLLELLARHQGMTLSRAQILERVWEYDFEGSSNIVDVYVSQLRRKLRGLGSSASIVTVWGIGYRLEERSPKAG